MNDLSDDGFRLSELDQQIIDLRIGGKGVAEVCRMLNVTPADINRAFDRDAQAGLSPAARVRTIRADQRQLEVIQEAFIPAAKAGDDRAALVVIRAQERKATLLGLNAPLRVDPIELARAARPEPNSTEKLRIVLENFLAQDKKRLINGGEGYGPGSWQDIQDRETMAERVAKGLPAVRVVAPYDPAED